MTQTTCARPGCRVTFAKTTRRRYCSDTCKLQAKNISRKVRRATDVGAPAEWSGMFAAGIPQRPAHDGRYGANAFEGDEESGIAWTADAFTDTRNLYSHLGPDEGISTEFEDVQQLLAAKQRRLYREARRWYMENDGWWNHPLKEDDEPDPPRVDQPPTMSDASELRFAKEELYRLQLAAMIEDGPPAGRPVKKTPLADGKCFEASEWPYEVTSRPARCVCCGDVINGHTSEPRCYGWLAEERPRVFHDVTKHTSMECTYRDHFDRILGRRGYPR